MEGERFDDLSRALALGAPRRDLLRGIASGVVTGAAAYLLGHRLPEARAFSAGATDAPGARCDIEAVYACIRNATELATKEYAKCDLECSPNSGDLIFALVCPCSERVRTTFNQEALKCRQFTAGSRLPRCGSGLRCTKDRRRGFGVCCPFGYYAKGRVCSPCNARVDCKQCETCNLTSGLCEPSNFPVECGSLCCGRGEECCNPATRLCCRPEEVCSPSRDRCCPFEKDFCKKGSGYTACCDPTSECCSDGTINICCANGLTCSPEGGCVKE
jgi:hypothetical protein